MGKFMEKSNKVFIPAEANDLGVPLWRLHCFGILQFTDQFIRTASLEKAIEQFEVELERLIVEFRGNMKKEFAMLYSEVRNEKAKRT